MRRVGAACLPVAKDGTVSTGCIGAGTGAMAGGIKGGLGTASLVLDSGLMVAAVVAVNSLGSVINPATGRPWRLAWKWMVSSVIRANGCQVATATRRQFHYEHNNRSCSYRRGAYKDPGKKMAQMAHDGLARAIRPSHTLLDGDIVFCLATGKKELPEAPDFFPSPQAQAFNELGHAAANCMSRAIISGILSARSLAGMIAFCDLEDR